MMVWALFAFMSSGQVFIWPGGYFPTRDACVTVREVVKAPDGAQMFCAPIPEARWREAVEGADA